MANTINKSKKPKSKRGTVRLRHKIEKASAAKQRKARKLAKKNPEWRSKLKKDPGIPNLFPYKEKLLNEIEENRLRKQEQAAKKREMARAAKTGTSIDPEEDPVDIIHHEDLEDSAMAIDDDDATAGDNSNPMAALIASARAAAKSYEQELQSGDEMDEDDDSFDSSDEDESAPAARSLDMSRKAYDKVFKQVVEQADVILYVLDARDPEGTRSREVEQSVMAAAGGGKRLILVLNKVDLVPSPVLRGWLTHLRRYFPTLPLRAAGPAPNARTFNHRDITPQSTSAALFKALKSFAASRNLRRAVSVGVIGYPNVGKSSVINALLSRVGHRGNSCPTGAEAGVTTGIRSVKIDSKLTLLDSPGIVFPSVSQSSATGSRGVKLSKEEARAHLVLLNAVPPKQIEDPISAVTLLLKRLSAAPELLQKLLDVYDIPPLMQNNGDTTSDFLVQVARKRGRLGRGGVPNLDSAAMTVITDWRDGRIQGWVDVPVLAVEGNLATPSASSIPPSGMKRIAGEEVTAPDQKTIVSEWAEEFKIEGLWGDGTWQEDDNGEIEE